MCTIPFFAAAILFACVSALPLKNETSGANFQNAMGKEEPKQGWTSSPNERGTADILWSCGSTVILCCWSMLCLNVPGPKDTYWIIIRRKVWIFSLTLCGPEVCAISSMGQYLSAHQSSRDFKAAGISDWTLQHAFFADMGGFVLQTRDWVPFPITAKQLLWLTQRDYISVSPAVFRHIKDRNKVDGMMRFIMVLQTLWFLANFFGRIALGLAITTIELTTVAFIYASLPMVFLWRHKPAEVGVAEVLVTDASMTEILLAGGEAAREPYSKTPLDFIDRKEWAWSIYWHHLRNILRYLRIAAGPQVRPADRVSNFDIPEIPTWVFCLGAVYYFGFAAIFVAGWNMSLPTHTEQLLWRVAGLLCLGTLFVGEIITEMAFTVWPYVRARWLQSCEEGKSKFNPTIAHEHEVSPDERNSRYSRPSNPPRPRPRTIWNWIRNNSVGQDKQVSMQLRVLLPMYVIGLLYITARVFIIVEDILELRSLPLSCYKTPDWQQFIPHLGG
ncbi:uncharacterized protein BDZ99DRAFT_469220 [Mytilinidion resinicola]|uniref:Uncharacterized protein n=1 Tax=Mytilinidion resinicola TaxID=574789 RepID=A0A6A6Y047_9PEZI|nr:uncharacterized protein BDZ99DRAFT_469220 [Mytilinidion resinicola]KAF2801918.1 hypothetical protein BDZ99DRAFT_469220 [Mytilinidion resinicola]